MYNLDKLTDSEKRHIYGIFDPAASDRIKENHRARQERARQIGDAVEAKRQESKAAFDGLLEEIAHSLRG